MVDSNPPVALPLNPNFGSGVFRRRIRLQGRPGQVIAELEDCSHGFRSVVSHNGETVTEVKGEVLRAPFTSCGGATERLKAMVGLPLNTPALTINRDINPRDNCTHLYDLSVLAIQHCLRGNISRQYDISVDDEVDQATTAKILRDGVEVLNWQVRQGTIIEPTGLAGNPLFRGFALWAGQAFSDDQQEAAFALQKGYFVAQIRVYDMNKAAGSPATDQPAMIGACYSYSSSIAEHAFRSKNSTRDFTDTPAQLLKFL